MALRFILLLALLGFASAQSISIISPPDRFVSPGEFVTLVFRLESAEALTVKVQASSSSDWRIVRQAGQVDLTPTAPKLITVTLEVPQDSPALAEESVRLVVESASDSYSALTRLTVTEVVRLSLEVPQDVTLSSEGFSIRIGNTGNAQEQAVLEFRRSAEILSVEEVNLAAGEELLMTLIPVDDGLHTVQLRGERGQELRRSVNVIRFGVPPPREFYLSGEVFGTLDSAAQWRTGLNVKGPLSDYLSLDARLEALAWSRSYAELSHQDFKLRLGGGWRDSFGLNISGDFGLGATAFLPGWQLAAHLGWLRDAQFSGFLLARYAWDDGNVAAGLGMRSGQPLIAMRADSRAAGLEVSATADYRQSSLNFAVSLDTENLSSTLPGQLHTRLGIRDLLTNRARLDMRVEYREDDVHAYGEGSAALASEAVWQGYFGITTAFYTDLPGRLYLAAQLGVPDSFLRLRHQLELGSWRAGNSLGLRYNPSGLGIEAATLWTLVSLHHLSLDGRLTYYPGLARVTGSLGLRHQLEQEPLTLNSALVWNIAEANLGLSSHLEWREAQWSAALNADLAYSYAAEAPGFNTSVSLSAAYSFNLPVPESLVYLAGDRKQGKLEISVLAAGKPLPDVELGIGRFQVRTDEAGIVSAALDPGDYRVNLNLGLLPITYRLLGEANRSVSIAEKTTTVLSFELIETAAVRGYVLLDTAGDGQADVPSGVAASLQLRDAEGLWRTLSTDSDGFFSARGLVPGSATLRVGNLPLGSTVNLRELELELQAGSISEVLFLVKPAASSAQTFAAANLRIRRIDSEIDRVPAGSAPLISVEVQGEAERVWLESASGQSELDFIDGLWQGRLDVPVGSSAGVFAYTASASAQGQETSRRAQLVVDPQAAAFALELNAPVRPGGRLEVNVQTYLSAQTVTVADSLSGETRNLSEATAGLWQASIPIPEDAEDAIYELEVRVTAVNGLLFQENSRFRVLAP